MGAGRRSASRSSSVARIDQPLIGVILEEDGREVVPCSSSEEEADEALRSDLAADALSLAGAWSDLDWDEMMDELDRIRHESVPTPPIDDL